MKTVTLCSFTTFSPAILIVKKDSLTIDLGSDTEESLIYRDINEVHEETRRLYSSFKEAQDSQLSSILGEVTKEMIRGE